MKRAAPLRIAAVVEVVRAARARRHERIARFAPPHHLFGDLVAARPALGGRRLGHGQDGFQRLDILGELADDKKAAVLLPLESAGDRRFLVARHPGGQSASFS